MLSIQDVGTEILEKHPRNFYAMIGSEFGIKEKYIQLISEAYGCGIVESQSVSELINMMSTKHLIPLAPKVYVVRYDEDFISSLDDKSNKSISDTKIIGTIVCIYESSKHSQKCEKYLPDHTVSIDSVSNKFIRMYLHKDFPNLPDRLIDAASEISTDYNNAKNICRCMSAAPVDQLYVLDDNELYKIFGSKSYAGDLAVKQGIASRNFSALVNIYEKYEGTDDEFIYNILATLIEIEKILTNKFVESDIRRYVSNWTLKDTYNMFMNTYHELKKLRTISQSSYETIIYLISLLQFSSIPDVEVMNS